MKTNLIFFTVVFALVVSAAAEVYWSLDFVVVAMATFVGLAMFIKFRNLNRVLMRRWPNAPLYLSMVHLVPVGLMVWGMHSLSLTDVPLSHESIINTRAFVLAVLIGEIGVFLDLVFLPPGRRA